MTNFTIGTGELAKDFDMGRDAEDQVRRSRAAALYVAQMNARHVQALSIYETFAQDQQAIDNATRGLRAQPLQP